MKYGIVGNPLSGRMSVEDKRRVLVEAGEILGCDYVIGGLDTGSREEFCDCVSDISKKVEIVVIAGGDGTVSDVINSVDPDIKFGYLPFGSACALRQVLEIPYDVREAAKQIRGGSVHHLDLLLCDDDRKGLLASIGINALTLQLREKLLKFGIKGGWAFMLCNVISVIVGKMPSFGYRMNLVPEARIDDGYLHLLASNLGSVGVLYNILKSFFVPIHAGEYRKVHNISITTGEDRYVQIDGNLYKKGKAFDFKVLPGAFKLIY